MPRILEKNLNNEPLWKTCESVYLFFPKYNFFPLAIHIDH